MKILKAEHIVTHGKNYYAYQKFLKNYILILLAAILISYSIKKSAILLFLKMKKF